MIPIVGVSGPSGVGKTTLAEKIVAELVRRGFRIGVIKHAVHPLQFDPDGKDSRRYAQAGATAVGIAGGGTVAMYLTAEADWSPAELAAKLFPELDLVLVEGFSQADIPRLGVLRRGVAEELKTKKGLIAVVADFPAEFGVPRFAFDQVKEIADRLETYIQTKRPKRDVQLFVNGKPIFIKPFVKDFILKPVAGMVEALKGTQGARRIQLVIDHPAGEAEDPEPSSKSGT